eukprot:12292111-Ditylum_brightwellii.AAC.1
MELTEANNQLTNKTEQITKKLTAITRLIKALSKLTDNARGDRFGGYGARKSLGWDSYGNCWSC